MNRAALFAAALLVPCLSWAAAPAQWYEAALAQPSVEAAQRRLEAGQRQYAAAGLAYAGAGQLFAGQTHSNDPRFVGLLTPQSFAALPFADDMTRYGVQYALPLDLFGAIAATRRAAEADRAMADLALRQQQLLALHAITEGFAQLVALREQQAVLDTQSERVAQTLARVQRQLDTGEASSADLRLAEAEQARLSAEAERLASTREAVLAQLAAAVGTPVQDPGTLLPAVPAWPQLEAGSALPVAHARAQAQGAQARADQARRALYPSVAAVGDWQRFEGDGNRQPEAWSVGAQLSLPIDPSGWKRAAAATAQAESARAEQDAAARLLSSQWAELGSRYRAARAELRAVQAECDALREVVDVRTELHRVGMLSTEDLLRQQRDLRAAQSGLAQARAQALLSWSAASVLAGMEPAAYREALSRDPEAP